MTSNPARAVNRAIANGAPIIEEKPTLVVLKARVDAASDAFDAACRPHFVNRWDYYRAVECGQSVPQSVHAACDAYLAATHAFYAARDGERGFLGSRGV